MMPLVAIVGVLAAFGGGQTAAPKVWGQVESSPAQPVADWIDDVLDDLDDIDDSLDDAEAAVGEQQGPLTGTDLTTVETDL